MRLLIETLKNLSPSSSSYRAEQSAFSLVEALGSLAPSGLCVQLHTTQSSKAEMEGRCHWAWSHLQASALLCSACGFAFCQLHCRTHHFFVLKEKIHFKTPLECKGDLTEDYLGGWGVEGGLKKKKEDYATHYEANDLGKHFIADFYFLPHLSFTL